MNIYVCTSLTVKVKDRSGGMTYKDDDDNGDNDDNNDAPK
jgi:hypothetical protein